MKRALTAMALAFTALLFLAVTPSGASAASVTSGCTDIYIAGVDVGGACIQHNASSVNAYIDRSVGGSSYIQIYRCPANGDCVAYGEPAKSDTSGANRVWTKLYGFRNGDTDFACFSLVWKNHGSTGDCTPIVY